MRRITDAEWLEFENELILDPTSNEVINYPELSEKFGIEAGSVSRRVVYLRNIGKLPQSKPDQRLDNYRRPYSDDELKKLKSLVENGVPHRQIAELLGRSIKSVRNKVVREEHKGNIKMRAAVPSEREQDEFIMAIQFDSYDCVTNYSELVQKFNLSRKQAWDRVGSLRRRGLIPRPKGPNPVSIKAIRDKWKRDYALDTFERRKYGKV